MNNLILSQISKNELVEEIAHLVALKLSAAIPTPQADDSTLIKSNEVCKLLGISRTTLKEWRDNKILPFQQINSRIYFRKCDIINAGKLKHRKK